MAFILCCVVCRLYWIKCGTKIKVSIVILSSLIKYNLNSCSKTSVALEYNEYGTKIAQGGNIKPQQFSKLDLLTTNSDVIISSVSTFNLVLLSAYYADDISQIYFV